MTDPRLAYLLKKFPRTSETFVLNEILAQEDLGRPLRILSRRHPDDEPRHPELARLRAEVEVLPPSREVDPWGTLFGEPENPERLFRDVGRVVQEAKEWGHPRFSSLLAEALYLLRRTRDLGLHHLHTHFATDSAVVAMLLHSIGGPTYSITAHAKDIYRSTVNPRLLDVLFERSEFVVTVCDANVEHLATRLGPAARAKVRRLYNGIDLSAFACNPDPAEREPDHLLAVGRLVQKKGFHVLLEALALLAREGDGLPFRTTVVGEGEEREALEAQIARLGLGDSVELTGARDLGQVRALMRTATVMCLPCIVGEDGNRDALPTVLVEAIASGLPVVSTPVTGIPEILRGGEAGLLVPESDPASLATAIARLFASPEERRLLADAGRRHAEETFDLREVSRTLSTWLDEAVTAQEARCASPA